MRFNRVDNDLHKFLIPESELEAEFCNRFEMYMVS